MKLIYYQIYTSPCGPLFLAGDEDKLYMCDWQESPSFHRNTRRTFGSFDAEVSRSSITLLESAISELNEYFTHKRKTFDIPLNFVGTDFQKSVWNALLDIPYGKTKTYAEIARLIGHPTSTRAVANAIGANPLSIFVPCHRVIGSNGSLTGYAGGLNAKRLLLNIEFTHHVTL